MLIKAKQVHVLLVMISGAYFLLTFPTEKENEQWGSILKRGGIKKGEQMTKDEKKRKNKRIQGNK